MNLKEMKVLKIRIAPAVLGVCSLLAYSCEGKKEDQHFISEIEVNQGDSIFEIQLEETIDSFDINYWSDEIYKLDKVQELDSMHEKINITCMSQDLFEDSICFQVQFDDSNRLITLATYYVFQKDSIIKEFEIE